MNKKIIFNLSLLFCLIATINFGQLSPVTTVNKKNDQVYGYINATGKVVVPMTYENAYDFSDSLGLVYSNGYQAGYVDATGKLKIPCSYTDGYAFHNGYALVVKDEVGFLIDKNNKKFPIDNIYISEKNIFCNGLIMIKNADGNYGFANLKNEVVIPCEYAAAISFSEGYGVVLGDGLQVVDRKGNKRPLNYSNAQSFSQGLLTVQKKSDGKYGVIDSNLNVIIDFNYDYIYNFKNDYVVFELNEKLGLVDKNGKTILPAEYVRINKINENRLLVQKDYTTAILLNEKFEVVKEFTEIFTPREDLNFDHGICPIYFDKGPIATAKDENVRKFGGILKCYINFKGDIVWRDEPYYVCFPKDAKIKMADFSEKEIQDIAIGDKILSFNQQANLYDTTTVTEVEIHEGNFELLEISLQSTATLTASNSSEIPTRMVQMIATPNHPILTKSGIKQMRELSGNDVLLVWNDAIQNFEELAVNEINSKPSTNIVYNLKTTAPNYVVNNVVVLMK